MAEAATKILEESLGETVLIKLRGNRKLRGKLEGFDLHMNLVLENAEDISNPDETVNLGRIIVRGDNVILISPPPR
jgi:small nuclear ribonucleoprotein